MRTVFKERGDIVNLRFFPINLRLVGEARYGRILHIVGAS